jgi:hypothetical protein
VRKPIGRFGCANVDGQQITRNKSGNDQHTVLQRYGQTARFHLNRPHRPSAGRIVAVERVCGQLLGIATDEHVRGGSGQSHRFHTRDTARTHCPHTQRHRRTAERGSARSVVSTGRVAARVCALTDGGQCRRPSISTKSTMHGGGDAA